MTAVATHQLRPRLLAGAPVAVGDTPFRLLVRYRRPAGSNPDTYLASAYAISDTLVVTAMNIGTNATDPSPAAFGLFLNSHNRTITPSTRRLELDSVAAVQRGLSRDRDYAIVILRTVTSLRSASNNQIKPLLISQRRDPVPNSRAVVFDFASSSTDFNVRDNSPVSASAIIASREVCDSAKAAFSSNPGESTPWLRESVVCTQLLPSNPAASVPSMCSADWAPVLLTREDGQWVMQGLGYNVPARELDDPNRCSGIGEYQMWAPLIQFRSLLNKAFDDTAALNRALAPTAPIVPAATATQVTWLSIAGGARATETFLQIGQLDATPTSSSILPATTLPPVATTSSSNTPIPTLVSYNGLSVGTIVGISIGVSMLFIGLAALAFMFRQRRRRLNLTPIIGQRGWEAALPSTNSSDLPPDYSVSSIQYYDNHPEKGESVDPPPPPVPPKGHHYIVPAANYYYEDTSLNRGTDRNHTTMSPSPFQYMSYGDLEHFDAKSS